MHRSVSRHGRRIAAALALLSMVTACGGGEEAGATATTLPQLTQAITGNHLVGLDQTGDGRSITVAQVGLDGTGYVAAYRSTNGAPGTLLGVSELLSAGRHENVTVTLSGPLRETTEVFLILHQEKSGNTTLDYPGADVPIEEDGRILTALLSLEVNATD